MTSDNSKTSRIRKIAGYLLPFILMGVFLYLAFKDVDLTKVFELISNASLFWLFIFLLSFILSHFVRAIRWKVMIATVKKDTSLLNLFGATMIGYGVNCVVPRLGELYRASFLGRWEHISRSSMLGTIILERIIDTLALGFAVLISVMIYAGDLYEEFEWLRLSVYLVFSIMITIIILIVLIIRLKEKFYNAITRFVGRISGKAAERLAYIFNMMTEGFATIRDIRSYVMTLFLTCIIMLLYGATSLVAFYLLKMDEVSVITFGMAWIVMSISAFGVVIPTPGGTGSYHLIVMSVLIGIFNFSEEISSAYAILTHFLSYVVFIFSTLFFVYFINKKRTRSGSAEVDFFSAFKIKPEEK